MLQSTAPTCFFATQTHDIFYATYNATIPTPTCFIQTLDETALVPSHPISTPVAPACPVGTATLPMAPETYCSCSEAAEEPKYSTKPKVSIRKEVPPSALRVGDYMQEALALLGHLQNFDNDDVTVICPR